MPPAWWMQCSPSRYRTPQATSDAGAGLLCWAQWLCAPWVLCSWLPGSSPSSDPRPASRPTSGFLQPELQELAQVSCLSSVGWASALVSDNAEPSATAEADHDRSEVTESPRTDCGNAANR